jgi:hypothetical protein
MVAVPLLVWVGLKEPHAPVGVQFAVQSTPLLEESPVTLAVTDVVSLTPSEEGGVGDMARLMELEEQPASPRTSTSNPGKRSSRHWNRPLEAENLPGW